MLMEDITAALSMDLKVTIQTMDDIAIHYFLIELEF